MILNKKWCLVTEIELDLWFIIILFNAQEESNPTVHSRVIVPNPINFRARVHGTDHGSSSPLLRVHEKPKITAVDMEQPTWYR